MCVYSATLTAQSRLPPDLDEPSLARAVEALADSWGAPLVDLDALFDTLRRREGTGPASAEVLADLYLAQRCAAHDGAALERFDARCIETLDAVLARVDPSSTFIDDIKQRVRTKLLVATGEAPPRIYSYAGRGPIDAWVRVIAVREATSAKRSERPWADSADPILDVEASLTSPELGLVKEQFRVEFERAFTEAMAELEPEQRNLLRHHYLHGLSFDEIGGIYALHRSSVGRRIDKARKTLLATTRRLLAARLATDRAEFERLLELIASRIDLSIERHLGG